MEAVSKDVVEMATVEPAFGWVCEGFCPETLRARKVGSGAEVGE